MVSKLPHPGPLIREARTRRKLSLEEVAAEVGASAATISRIETQRSRGSTDNLEKLAAFLEIDPRLLVVGDLAALEAHDPTTPDPEPPEDRTASEDRGTFRSLPIETFARTGGHIDGSLAIDVIKRPSGKWRCPA